MENTAFFVYLRPVKSLFMVLTLGSALYLIYIFFSAYQGLAGIDNDVTAGIKKVQNVTPVLGMSAQPDETAVHAIQERDIFSSAAIKSSPEQLIPTEQLPANLKVVGILISEVSQIVIEDVSARQTYFVSEGKPEGGIVLRHADKHKIVIDYQGQNISLPVTEPPQQTVVSNVAIP